MIRFARIGSGLIGGLLLVCGQTGHAQSCRGLPSLATMSKVLSAAATSSGENQAILGRFGLNGKRAFAGAQAGYAAPAFESPGAPLVGIDLGYAFTLGKASGLELCPVLQSVYEHGPRGRWLQQTALASRIGLSLGRNVQVARSLGLVPYVQGAVLHSRIRYGPMTMTDQNGKIIGSFRSTDDRFASQAQFGVGLRLGDRFTVTPSFNTPIGSGRNWLGLFSLDNTAAYSVSASFALQR